MFLLQCNYEPNVQLWQRKAPSVRSDHYILQCVMFSEASVLGLIHCVVAYKGVLTLYLDAVWFETTVIYYPQVSK